MHIHTGCGEPQPEKLIDSMQSAGVYGGAIISACPEDSTAALFSLPYNERLKNVLAWTKNDRLFPVLWVSPFENDIENKIKNASLEGIRAFKIICDSFYVYSPENMRLLEAIESISLPVIFHSGILWSGTDTSRFNRPADWECLLNLESIKFSMGHCSWPWHDECIAVYGKFLNSYLSGKSSEMFFDITPGTPKIYREDLLTKLYTVGYDTENNIMFGTDSLCTEYDSDWVRSWLELDGSIFDKLNITAEQREKVYSKNFLRFISGDDVSHKLPQMNR